MTYLVGESLHSSRTALRADIILSDPPDSVAIDGSVSGRGSVKHREPALATGEIVFDGFGGVRRGSAGFGGLGNTLIAAQKAAL